MRTPLLFIILIILSTGVLAEDINAGLAAHWAFNEGSGDILFDSSENNNIWNDIRCCMGI